MAKKLTIKQELANLFEPVKKKRFYEMVVIIKPYLPEHIRKKSEKRIEDILTKYNAKLKAKAYWGKRILAYKIDGHKEGYYIIYHFEAPSSEMANIRRYIDKHPELLRYMIIQLEEMSFDRLKLLVKKAVVLE